MRGGHPLGIRVMFPDIFCASGVDVAFLLTLIVSLSDRSLSGDPCSLSVAIVNLAEVCSGGGSALRFFISTWLFMMSASSLVRSSSYTLAHDFSTAEYNVRPALVIERQRWRVFSSCWSLNLFGSLRT